MDELVVILWVTGGGLALIGFVIGWTRRGLRRQLRRMPRTLVREAHQGPFVKMAGRLTARAPVRSPLADVDCAYFAMTVSERMQESDEELSTLFTDREYAEGLALEDETGRIALEAEGALFDYLRVREFSPSAVWTPELRSDLVRRYITHTGRPGNTMRLHEERLEVGLPVVAFGWLRQERQGLVLTGGSDLHILGESEQHLLRFHALDLLPPLLMLTGLLLVSAGVAHLFAEPPPPPNLEMTPLPRPPPGPQLPR